MSEKTPAQEYWNDVREYAKDILDELEIRSQEDFENSRDDIQDRLHETVDGSQWIIYYYRNLQVLEHTDNADYADDQGFELTTNDGWRSLITQVSFWAMYGDLWQIIEALKDDLPES